MLLPAAIASVTLASAFFVMLRRRAPRWAFLVLGVLPPAGLLLASTNLRVYGYHGFVQAGIVYRLLHGGVPPGSPLLAGQPGTYPWAGALVLAGVSRLLGVSPFWSAALVAIASLAVLLVLTYRIGLLVTADPEASLFGTAASLYAFTFTQSVPDSALKSGLARLLPLPFVEPRGAPILEKFNGCTSFPLGLALYALTLLLLLRLATEGSPRWRSAAAFAATLLALAFVYPYFMPPMALLCGIAAFRSWRGGVRPLAFLLAGSLALVGMIVLPYYLQLRLGRTNAVLQLVPAQALIRQVAVILVTFLPMSILLVGARRAIRERLRAGSPAASLLLASATVNLLLFAFLLAPLWSQYKFLLLGEFALGIVGGVALRALYARSWPVALAVLSLFLLPFGLDCVHKARDWSVAPRTYREAGMALEHEDPARRELDRWMRTATHPRAVFVDTDLGVPVYGQRSLYVAMPKQEHLVTIEEQAGVPTPGDGYTLDPRIFLKDVDGAPAALVDQRGEVAARLLSGREYVAADVADVAACGPEAYLVRRPVASDVDRTHAERFPVVFENAAATVIALRR
ncbi:MAG: hypothetical protein U0599_02650 [Vicinamibacteria bacterium]